MARTPLLNVLVNLTRERARAEQAEQGREGNRREAAAIGRRAVLRGAAGLAVASALPLTGLEATARIAVVGAGLAGLAAARELRNAGLTADIYEGSTRIGGRCFTARGTFGDGQVAEHGGEFIDTAHTAIRDLARDLGLTLDDVLKATPPTTRPLFSIGGKPYNLADASRDWQPVYPVLQAQNAALGDYSYKGATADARRFDAMTVSQWVGTYVPGGRQSQLGLLIETAFAEENGADADQQSALNLIPVLAADKRRQFNLYSAESDQRFHVRGGNDQIPTLIAKSLGDGIRTGTPLAAIATLPDGRVRLSFRRDSGVGDQVYDRVILTIPFSVMRARVDYKQAGFQPLKNQAIAALPMGASTKFQLQFTRRAWTEVGCDGEMRVPSETFQTTWEVSRGQPGSRGILNFFSGGTRAINAGKTDAVTLAGTVMREAAAITPGLADIWTGLMIKDAWHGNPWSLGSYSYYQPGYQTTVLGIEREREGNCFFAGEHTADENGFLNAGVETGQRAAREVIASLR
jgi:monoamine oxidase